MMPKYRIRIYNTQGLEIMTRAFEDRAEYDSYWKELQKKESLMGFSGQGLLVFAKETMTPMGNWEAEDRIPILVSSEAI